MTPPYYLILAPEAVQHLSAKRFRSVQNYPTPLAKESTEAKPRLKKREKPTNKLTFLGVFQTYRPSALKLTTGSVVSDFPETPTSTCSVPHPGCRTQTNDQLLLNRRRPKGNRPESIPRPPHHTYHSATTTHGLVLYEFLYILQVMCGHRLNYCISTLLTYRFCTRRRESLNLCEGISLPA
uniref:Uncharacterized protein n=1 Tax=Heterorhabditis bacteriophora TaxID=37862 RepID=A0A1I7WGR7_HETBA